MSGRRLGARSVSGVPSPTFDLPPDELRRLGALAADAVAAHREQPARAPGLRQGRRRGPRSSTSRCPRRAGPSRRSSPSCASTSSPTRWATRTRASTASSTRPRTRSASLADFLAAAMNPNCWGGDHAAIHVEDARHALARARCSASRPTAEGILVSGGSMANFTALAAARRAMTPGNVREDGLAGPDRAAADRLRVRPGPLAASTRRWTCSGSARSQLRKIATDDAIPDPHGRARGGRRRRPGGGLPAGDRRRQRRHGQHGRDRSARRARRLLPPRVALVPRRRRVRRAGGDRRRSWRRSSPGWSAPTRSPPTRTSGSTCPTRRARRSCASPAASPRRSASSRSTSPRTPRARSPGPAWFAERGVELSRGFKALKVWMGLKTHGRRAYAAQIENDVRLARFPRRRGRPPAGLRAAGRVGPLDRELPLPPGGRRPLRRRARPDQPPHHQPPGRRRLLLPRAHDPEGPHGPARLDHQLPDARGGPDRAARRGGAGRRGARHKVGVATASRV